MNQLTFIFFVACLFVNSLNKCIAQSARFTIDSYKYNIESVNEKQTIKADFRIDKIILGISDKSKNKNESYDNIGLEIYGIAAGTYVIGKAAEELSSKNGTDKGTASVSVNYWVSNREQKNLSTSLGLMEESFGNVTLTKVENAVISGSFKITIDGIKIEGSFENIKVESWPE